MEAQSALVRTDGAVELHAIADVHLHFALVVDPGHAEGGDAFGLYEPLHDFCFFEFRVLVVHINDGFQHFSDGLQILSLAWMLELQLLHNLFNIHSSKILVKQSVMLLISQS